MRRFTFFFAIPVALIVIAVARHDSAFAGKSSTSRPKLVLIVRHAEKPPTEADSIHLNDAGRRRAEELSHLFDADRKDPLPAPDFVIAAQNSKHSHRCVETMTPLSKTRKLPIDESIASEDVARVAQLLFGNPKYAGKTVLICWHHGMIPELAAKLGVADPPNWKSSTFDRIWQLTYDANGSARLLDRPQNLMPGDASR